MSNERGYKAIESEASRLGWPTHWATDLTVHDKAVLARESAPAQFGWSIRRSGTDLYIVGSEWSIDWLNANIKHLMGRTIYYYFYDGSELRSLPAEELLKVLQKGVPDD